MNKGNVHEINVPVFPWNIKDRCIDESGEMKEGITIFSVKIIIKYKREELEQLLEELSNKYDIVIIEENGEIVFEKDGFFYSRMVVIDENGEEVVIKSDD